MRHDTAVLIGSGGMGQVFKAWDPDLERWVALKYLHHADPEMVERLMREARAQARIDHPGICKVYEVGTDDGRPFIAMEYVEGRLLHEAAEGLTVEQKILLVKQVTEAVQAAHAQGLIHRDLKPGNIMVSESDEGGRRAYVLDFGIAREQEVQGLTVSGQVLGTPGYLSPEQARGELKNLDRRTDIFSIGVMLYEILGGARPFAGDSNVEILVALLEQDPMPLKQKNPSIHRDLNTVVMRCLEKDPDRRYPSARALADDLGRYLAGEPVAAAPISFRERIIRKIRKNPMAAGGLLIAVVAVTASVVGGVAGWVKYTVDLKRERNAALEAQSLAEAKEHEAREITDFLIGVFENSDPDESHGEEITAREILDRGVANIENRLNDRPEIRARLLGIMGEVFTHLGMYDRSEPLLQQAFDAVVGLEGHTPESEIEVRVRLADLYRLTNTMDDAVAVSAPIAGIVEAHADLDPSVAAQGLGCLGRVEIDRGHFEEAGRWFVRAVEIAENAHGGDAPLVGDLLNDLCYVSYRQKRWGEAISQAERALKIREKAYGPDDPRVATTLNSLAQALRGAGRIEESAEIMLRVLEIRERTLGPDHPRTGVALNNLGLAYLKMRRWDEAEAMFQQSLDIRIKTFGPVHPNVARVLGNLAAVYRDRGDLQKAEATYRRALVIQEQSLGPDHPDLTFTLGGIARTQLMRGQSAAALPNLQRCLRIREEAFGKDSPSLIGLLKAIGETEFTLGNVESARRHVTRARAIAAAAYGPDHSQVEEFDRMIERIDNPDRTD